MSGPIPYLIRAAALVRQFEGCELVPYEDVAGKWTVGFGHRCGPAESRDEPITEDRAMQLLDADLDIANGCVNALVRVPLNDNQRIALISFVFNLGCGRLRNSTLLRKLNDGDYDGAATEFLRWAMAGGEPVRGLMRRRAAEQQLFMQKA